MKESELTTAGLQTAFECGRNHTTLKALRLDRSWSNLQTIHFWPLDIAKIEEQMQRWGDKVPMHHEFARDQNGPVMFGLPLFDFKKIADPYGLMNPGKTEGWHVGMARLNYTSELISHLGDR